MAFIHLSGVFIQFAFLVTLVFSTNENVPFRDKVLVIDVDNTIYSERVARSRGVGIEEQIVRNTHRFCQNLGLRAEEADALFQHYGSTIEGIRQRHEEQGKPKEELQAFIRSYYDTVWRDLDYSSLLPLAHADTTGYTHTSESSSSSLRDLLQNIPYPIYLASNSPSWHVRAVIDKLGLSNIPWTGMLSPDSVDDDQIYYPTKNNPKAYYSQILERHPSSQVVLIDDSVHNLRKALKVGIDGIPVKNNLEESLAIALGHVDKHFVFSETQYLAAKNAVDAKSINKSTWERLVNHITLLKTDTLTVTDIGAGRLSMLEMMQRGTKDKTALFGVLQEVQCIHYHAYESNLNLFGACLTTLEQLGFEVGRPIEAQENQSYSFAHPEQNITVHLHMYDIASESMKSEAAPQLLVGCCFADLMQPNDLVTTIDQFLSKWSRRNSSILAYFPITFAGTTQFLPPRPFGLNQIPSDTTAFKLYSKALCHCHGHNLDPDRLVCAIEERGGQLLSRGPSKWVIDKKRHPYFWKTMMYFFGTVGGAELLKEGWNSFGWIQRATTEPEEIIVSNHDLLFEWTRGNRDVCDAQGNSRDETVEEIQFTAPYEVATTRKIIDRRNNRHLESGQVEIVSLYSLISSGTELKIFRGQFDDAALDVNIKGMDEERMAYPLAYGYSLVGRIESVAQDVDDDMIGKLVFTFSPHSTRVVCDVNAVQVVPDGIEAKDAIFMPSVETAVSIVHDAHVRVGENIAVYGQGLIGLLVTAILNEQTGSLDTTSGRFGTLTVFDTIPDRLALASNLGASQALLPRTAPEAGPFDVSIEVSGNFRALQSSIDFTKDGGRVIIGSWYGNSDVQLKLGIDFHRSHKTLQTSQVSEIPAELSALWDKQRRFDVSWELVKLLRPSRLITRVAKLSEAKSAFDALDNGDEIAVAFRYDN